MVATAAVLFTAGIGVGYTAKVKPVATMYQGQEKQQAAQALLDVALVQAGKGSWERPVLRSGTRGSLVHHRHRRRLHRRDPAAVIG